jgi:hypothetical protein
MREDMIASTRWRSQFGGPFVFVCWADQRQAQVGAGEERFGIFTGQVAPAVQCTGYPAITPRKATGRTQLHAWQQERQAISTRNRPGGQHQGTLGIHADLRRYDLAVPCRSWFRVCCARFGAYAGLMPA